jgi:hypothetical protein
MDDELIKPFKLCFSILKTRGLWQNGKQSWKYLIYGLICHFICFDFLIASSIVQVTKAKNLEDLCNTLLVSFLQSMIALKCSFFVFKLKKIKSLIETLNSLLEFSARKKFPKRDKIHKEVFLAYKVFKIFLVFSFVTSLMGALPILTLYKLPYKTWYPFLIPFDTENGEIGFWIASIFFIINGPFYVGPCNLSLNIFLVIFMSFAVGMTKELAERFSDIGNIEMPAIAGTSKDFLSVRVLERSKNWRLKQQNQELKKCIEIHQKICEFVREVEQIFTPIIFVHGFIVTIIFCLIAFTMFIYVSF